MDERDESARVAQVESDFGIETATVEAAYWVLRASQGVRLRAVLYHPEDGFFGADDFQFDAAYVAEQLASDSANLLASLRLLNRYLSQQALWERLCMANPTPATIGRSHGPCYSEAAFRLGDQAYSNLYVPIDPHFNFIGIPLSKFPAITPDDIQKRSRGGAAGFARCAANLLDDFDLDLAREHLAKEVLRTTGKLPNTSVIGHHRSTSPNDPRDTWMYAQKVGGKTHGEILSMLAKEHIEWEQLENEQSVGKAIARFCERSGRPPLRRKLQK